MRHTTQITWRGYKLEVTGETDGHDAELENITKEYDTPLIDLLESCTGNQMTEITEAFVIAAREVEVDMKNGSYY